MNMVGGDNNNLRDTYDSNIQRIPVKLYRLTVSDFTG